MRSALFAASALFAFTAGCAAASGTFSDASSGAPAVPSPAAVISNTSAGHTSSSSSSSSSSANMVDTKTFKPFPAPQAAQTRWVIQLPPQANEADWRVELIPGKHMSIDCNHHRLTGKLHTHTVQGWGYDYYTFVTDGNITSTLIGCPPSSQRHAFVQGESLMLRYNSRLPLVIYTGKAYQLQYRIWQARPMQNASAR